jgi:predicted metal-binding protein
VIQYIKKLLKEYSESACNPKAKSKRNTELIPNWQEYSKRTVEKQLNSYLRVAMMTE